ncbi:MAG: hypothetical protein ACI9TK_000807 [Flavobacteriaceae bacterium]|jgi:hypothetical protein|tara:strand:- start:3163 stop:3660 length:498 start_codon:yes stop_codon:yes gene_type:complete
MYSNSKLYLTLLLVAFLFSFSSCHFFESTKIPAKEIKTASNWSEKDQAPSFSSCEGQEAEDEASCFEETISFTILNYINENPWIASETIDEEVIMNLLINKEGLITLESVDASNDVLAAIPDMENSLIEAVNLLPQAQPAVKTNVGTLVASSFQLPLKIYAEEKY